MKKEVEIIKTAREISKNCILCNGNFPMPTLGLSGTFEIETNEIPPTKLSLVVMKKYDSELLEFLA